MAEIYIDADGCAVKEEIYKVAKRFKIKVFVVANKSMGIPFDPLIEMKVVPGVFDAADDWIAERITASDAVVTADIPLADRCLKKGARAIGPKGDLFSIESIGDALATRELMARLREMGEMRGGPAPMQKKDKSRFLMMFDRLLHSLPKDLSKT